MTEQPLAGGAAGRAGRLPSRFFAREVGFLARLNQPATDFLAHLPLRLEFKLIIAFLGIVGLLVALGVAGLAVLAEADRRSETLIKTEQRIDALRHLEHHGHSLLLSMSSALWMPGKMVDTVNEQIDHLKANLAALGPVSADEASQIEALRKEYATFIDMLNREAGLLRSGDIDLAGALQIEQVLPEAARVEEAIDKLVSAAAAEMNRNVAASRDSYHASHTWLIGFVVVASVLSLYLAHTISTFVVLPLRAIGSRLARIAAGEFAPQVQIPNRDELGELAENVNRTSEQLGQLYTELEIEKERSEELLFHTLPRPIVQRIKDGEALIADRVAEATILFSDLAGFTELSDHLAPEEVLDILDVLFSRYDAIADRLGLEKIKTIGDGYMVAAGTLVPRPDHAAAVAEMALAMRAATDIATRALGVIGQPLRVRIGIHSGPLVAGVLGAVKPVYDVWGDTVNTASRMEHYGEPRRIAVSARTRGLLGNQFRFEPREIIEVKGKGAMETFFLERHIGPRRFSNMGRRLAAARAASPATTSG